MEEERVGTLWGSREKDMSSMSLCGSTSFTKKLNCLSTKLLSLARVALREPCFADIVLPCLGWVTGAVLAAGYSGEGSWEPWGLGYVLGRGQTPFLQQRALGSSTMASSRCFCHSESSPFEGLSVHPQKAAGPHSPGTEDSHFKQQHSGLILHCLVTCNSSCVEVRSKGTVHLASWSQGRLHLTEE